MARQSKTTFAGLVDFSGTTHAGIKLNSLTTTERDALTPAVGMMIYNSTTATVQRYENGAWKNASGNTVVSVGNANADYITDGVADNVQIQAAIDAVNTAGGGIIFLKEGAYDIAAQINMKSNIHLIGEGVGVLLTLDDTLNIDVIGCSDTTNGHDDFSIENIEINGNKSNQTAGSGINIKQSRNFVIKGVTVTNCKQHGINIDGTLTEFAIVEKCITSSNDGAGINLVNTPTRVMIRNNFSSSNGAANINIAGNYITVDGNFCKTSGTADNITGYDSTNNHMTVTNNQCFDGNNHGIHIAGNYLVVSHNQVYDTVNDGIYIATTGETTVSTDVIVSNNKIRSAGRYGIRLANVAMGACSDNVINASGTTGIIIEKATGIGVVNNKITGSVTGDGIRLHMSARNQISLNTCKNNARYGIYITDDGATASLYNQITENHCYDDQGTKTQDYAIFSGNSSDYNIITGNIVRATDHTTGSMSLVGSNNIIFNNIGYDSEITTLNPTPILDHRASGTAISLNANEAQAFGDVCFINSSGQAQLADADAIATAGVVAMCISPTVSADANGNYLLIGIARDDTWNWTVGGLIYLSTTGTTGNTLTQTAPSGADDVVQVLGVATHADRMYFNPQLVQIEHI